MECLIAGSVCAPTPQAQQQLDEAVDHEADPEIDQQSPVELVGSMPRGRGKVRYEDEKVKEVANEDSSELLEDAAGHGFRVMRDSVEDESPRGYTIS